MSLPDLSLIIPAWQGDAALFDTKRFIAVAGIEIIFSLATDEEIPTAAEQSEGVKTLFAAKGRAAQMNAGAATASGEYLLFLHADTVIEPSSLPRVRELLDERSIAIGAYTFASEGKALRYRAMEMLVALRCALLKAPYGDQALFIRRELFEAIGGYDESLSLFEDLRLVDAARRHGRLAFLDDRAVTSCRRYDAQGFFATTLRHLWLLARYKRS